MVHLINIDALVTEIKRRLKFVEERLKKNNSYTEESNIAWERDKALYNAYNSLLHFLDTLEVIDPYAQCIQYASIESGIKAHAENYSFNIESELFNQLTKEQQALWRKEIEQACISGGEVGLELARDLRYKENLEVKEVNLKQSYREYINNTYSEEFAKSILDDNIKGELDNSDLFGIMSYGFELGIKAKKDNIRHSMNETPNYPCDILFVTNVDNMFLYRYMENGRPVDNETPYFHNILNGKCWYYCNDIVNK